MLFDSWLDQEDTKFKYEPKKAPPTPAPSPVPPQPTPHKQHPPTPTMHTLNTQAPTSHHHTFSNPPVPSYNTLPPHTYNAPPTPTPTHVPAKPQHKIESGPFHLEKQVPPSPVPRAVAPQTNPPPLTTGPPPPSSHPSSHSVQNNNNATTSYGKGSDPYALLQPSSQRNLRTEDRSKARLLDRLMDFLDNPERFAVIRAEVAPYFTRKNDHK